MELILLATYTNKEQKAAVVQKASLKIDMLKFFLQLVWELKIIDNKHFIAFSEPLSEVGKMIGGWKKQLGKESPPIEEEM